VSQNGWIGLASSMELLRLNLASRGVDSFHFVHFSKEFLKEVLKPKSHLH
jgi:hypothetical protein